MILYLQLTLCVTQLTGGPFGSWGLRLKPIGKSGPGGLIILQPGIKLWCLEEAEIWVLV